MLLSLVGVPREQKTLHRGAELALAVAEMPERRSRVFRKLRRGSDLEETRPDYQDLLIDLTLWVWLRPGTDSASPPLSSRVPAALENPASITRIGGLSLGESSYLVDIIRIDGTPPDQLTFLTPDPSGFYSLPVWVDHADHSKTVLERFSLSEPVVVSTGLRSAWVRTGEKS
jgi:CRISPR-associated protein Cas5t